MSGVVILEAGKKGRSVFGIEGEMNDGDEEGEAVAAWCVERSSMCIVSGPFRSSFSLTLDDVDDRKGSDSGLALLLRSAFIQPMMNAG
jgi:hypothetical protein